MSKKSRDGNDGLTPEQIAIFKNVVRDPVLFASHVLGLDLWPREAEILRSIKAQRRTAIKACHSVAKPSLWPLRRSGGLPAIARASF